MIKARNVFLLVCISVVFGSCNKFSNGVENTWTRTLDKPFQIVEMRDNVNVTLKHCDVDNPTGSISITTGENLIDDIGTEVEEMKIAPTDTIHDTLYLNKLVISNNNTLSFLRPYDYKLEMTVYYDTLFELIFHSNANITTDTIRGYDYLTDFSDNDDTSHTVYEPKANLLLEINGGSGDFHVLTNCYRLMTQYIHGTSNLFLHGKVERAETYGDYDCHGVIDGRDLEAYSYHMINLYGTNKVYAKAFKQIIARNENIGHIYYLRYNKPGIVTYYGHFDDQGHYIPPHTGDTVYSCPLSVIRRGAYKDSITSIYTH